MRKSELIRENNRLRIDNDALNRAVEKYKKLLESTRDCYGAKLMELEQKRLLLEHPDIIVDDIEWYTVRDYVEARYKFVYSIKGERQ